MLSLETIHKVGPLGGPAPNMADYALERELFSWLQARQQLAGLPGGLGINIAYEAVDRHLAGPGRDRPALRCIDRRGSRTEITYAGLADASNRFANVLDALGVRPGEMVFVLMPRTADLYVAFFGTLKHRSVVSPLFPAFGPEPIRRRLELGDARVLVTTPGLYRRKVAAQRPAALPRLKHVLLAGDPGDTRDFDAPEGTLDLRTLLRSQSRDYTIAATDPEEVALLHFTSGATGRPEGAVHVHEAVVSHHATGRMALDLHPEDVFWCTADPGWVTGTSYGIISPLTHASTCVVDAGDFDARRWYELLESEKVTVWYTSPTALRMLMRSGAEAVAGYDLSRLRFIASVGEPLDPEVISWARETLGRPVHDNWWQTETGAIMIANYASMDIHPGSMGRPMPGVEATVLQLDDDRRVVVGDGGSAVEAPIGEEGELALRPGWPSMFRGYLGEEERYLSCFAGGWYLSGDLARKDDDGYFWFVGRSDDVIESAGHLIGPFEVESALMEHPAVAEVGVVGEPDALAGEVVKAFVSLSPGYRPSDELRLDLIGFARTRLGAAIAPREICFEQHLPHTESGKIVRRLLRARDMESEST